MIRRMIGAAGLKSDIFEEVEADKSATLQAALVVVIVALATGIGSIESGSTVEVLIAVLAAVGGALVSWVIWAWITYFIGTTIFRTEQTEADWGQLARTLAFAQSPGVFKVFGAIPYVGPVIFFVAAVWQLVAMVIAIRQALDYTSTLRAVGVALIGFAVMIAISALLYWLL